MTFPRTVCQHTTHGADRTLTFEDGIEAAAKWHDAEMESRLVVVAGTSGSIRAQAQLDALIHRRSATAIRSATPQIDMEALVEKVAWAADEVLANALARQEPHVNEALARAVLATLTARQQEK